MFRKDLQYYKFCAYGFLKNLRFFEPFLYLFFLEKGLTYLQIGTLITVREVLRNVLEIPTGVLADMLGRRRTMISAFLFYLISFVIFYLTSSYGLFVVAMLFYSAGDAFRSGTHKAMIFEYLRLQGWESMKVDYYGHTRSWSQMGSALSSLLAAGIVFWSGDYAGAFLFSTVPYVLDLLLLASYPRELDGQVKRGSRKQLWRSFREILDEIVRAFRNPETRRVLTNLALFSGTFRAVKDYYQPVLATLAAALALHISGAGGKQVTALLIGVIYFFLYLATSFSSRHAGAFTRRRESMPAVLNRTLVAGMALITAAGLFFLLPGRWQWSVILPFTAVYMLENIRRPVGVAYVSSVFPPGILATVLSTESQVRSLFAAAIAPAAGWLIDKTGVGCGLAIIAAVLLTAYPLVRLGRNSRHGTDPEN
jgi:MFS family permease